MKKNKMRKIFNNKKAFSEVLFWWLIFKIGFAIAVVFGVLLIVQSGYGNINYGSRAVDAKIVANTFMHSRVLMRYDAVTDRLYAGNIDANKWNETVDVSNQLDFALDTGEINYMAMKLTLIKESGNLEAYYKQNLYNEWNTYYEGHFRGGSGGYIKQIIAYPVTYGLNYESAILKVEVLVPHG